MSQPHNNVTESMTFMRLLPGLNGLAMSICEDPTGLILVDYYVTRITHNFFFSDDWGQ